MPKWSGVDSSAAVDLTSCKASRGDEPTEEVDQPESTVELPIVLNDLEEIFDFVRRTSDDMVPTNLYNYFVVLKYLLGAKRAGADLFIGAVCMTSFTEHRLTPPTTKFLASSDRKRNTLHISLNRPVTQICRCWGTWRRWLTSSTFAAIGI